MRAYERDSHKHANTSIYERAHEIPSHKHAEYKKIYERAYERDSHKHANTSSIYERAYERDSHKHAEYKGSEIFKFESRKWHLQHSETRIIRKPVRR